MIREVALGICICFSSCGAGGKEGEVRLNTCQQSNVKEWSPAVY